MPARDGALRVLRAARDAGVRRVVLTSSFAAVGYGHPDRDAPYDEASWTDLDGPGISPYIASKTLAERAELEDEKSRLYDLWQTNLGKAKGEAARLFGERAKRKGKWAEWVRAELDGMSPPEFSNMVRSEVNKLMAAAK